MISQETIGFLQKAGLRGVFLDTKIIQYTQWSSKYPRHAWALEQLSPSSQAFQIIAMTKGVLPESMMKGLWELANDLECVAEKLKILSENR